MRTLTWKDPPAASTGGGALANAAVAGLLKPAMHDAAAAAAAATATATAATAAAPPEAGNGVYGTDAGCCLVLLPWRRSESRTRSHSHSHAYSRIHSRLYGGSHMQGINGNSLSAVAVAASAFFIAGRRGRAGGNKIAPINAAAASSPRDKEVVAKAISLRGLRRLKAQMEARFGDAFGSLSTQQIVRDWVVRVTAGRRCRLAEMPEVVDPRDLGPPHYFISHAWANSFAGLVRVVEGFLGNASDETRVWLDIVAVNQHEGSEQNAADAGSFQDVVQEAVYGTLVVIDAPCNPASRAWCVYEWAATLSCHGPDGLMMPLNPLERVALVAGLDISRAVCSVASDWKMIMQQVRSEHGSVDAFNERLKLMLVLQPLSYRDDMRRLLARCHGTPWDFSAVHAWLAQYDGRGGGGGGGGGAATTVAAAAAAAWVAGAAAGPVGSGGAAGGSTSGPPRMLCVLAGAGEGKSTISAALCGTLLSPTGAKHVTGLYHFVKYSDQRRLDPLHVVRSLAFQLAERIPKLRPTILRANFVEIAETGEVGAAVQGLLLDPLRQLAALRPQQQVVILLDALDEADPLPPARTNIFSSCPPSAAGGARPPASARPKSSVRFATSSASAHGVGRRRASSSVPATATASIVPLGNKVFQLLVKHLQSLPPCVRFVVTTRPDGLGGHIIAALQRAFGGGGVQFLTPAQLRPVRTSTATGFLLPFAAAASDAARASSGVLVYLTVVRECGLNPPTASKRPVPAGWVPQMADLHWAYSQVFAKGMIAMHCGASCGSGSGAAATLSISSSIPAAVDGRLERMQELLAVLLAAQEPLPESLLQSMGLRDALEQLPGYGVLFYVDEHRVHTLHKSLADWLTGGSASESPPPFEVDPIEGHRLLAQQLYDSVMGQGGGGGAAGAAASGPGGGGGSKMGNLPPYTLKYTVRHLVCCGDVAGLESLLQSFEFVSAVFSQGHGHILISDALRVRDDEHSPLLADLQRGYLAQQHKLASGGAKTADGVAACLMACPASTDVYKLAREYLLAMPPPASGGRLREVLGGNASWSPLRMTLEGHGRSVTAVTWSPDGKTLASASVDNTLRLWDVANGQCVGFLKGHLWPVTAVAWSPDGKTIVSGSVDNSLRLWDVASGLCTATLEGHGGSVSSVCWCPDGKALASGSNDRTIRLWDLASGSCTCTLEGHVRPVTCVAWSPDGKTLASGSDDKTVRLWDVASGLWARKLKGNRRSVKRLYWTPEGKPVGNTATYEEALRLWASGQCIATLEGHLRPVSSVAWSPDGKTLASGSADNSVRLWDVTNNKCTGTLEGRGGQVASVAWNLNGKALVNASYDGTLRLWDVASGKCTGTLEGHGGAVVCVSWSPNGKTIASGSDDSTLRLWDGASSKNNGMPEGQMRPVTVTCVSWSGDGKTLANGSYDGTIRLWDVASGRCDGTLQGHEEAVISMAWSPDGKTLASGSDDNMLRLWDVASGQCVCALEGHEGTVCSVAWSPDGKTLASGGEDTTLRLWDVGRKECTAVLEAHIMPVVEVAWSPDGKIIATGSDDNSLRLWDVASGKDTHLLQGHAASISAIAWSPSCMMLASGSDDNSLRLWDVASGKCTATLEGHTRPVTSLAWRPNGSILASGSVDNMVRLWDAAGGGGGANVKYTGTLEGNGGAVTSVFWTADGSTLASGGDDMMLRLWDVAN